MTTEEKAKCYDEALERAKMSYHTGDYDKDTLEMLEIIFPELVESEDEKIRKDLIEWFEEFPDSVWRGNYKKDIIAWLKKQGEQKHIINGILTATNYDKMFQKYNVHKFNVGDTIKITGINNGHIGCSILNTEDGYYYNWKLIENKPDWNEENDDDAWMNDIISKVENNLQLNKAEINWLKSIKEKIK